MADLLTKLWEYFGNTQTILGVLESLVKSERTELLKIIGNGHFMTGSDAVKYAIDEYNAHKFEGARQLYVTAESEFRASYTFYETSADHAQRNWIARVQSSFTGDVKAIAGYHNASVAAIAVSALNRLLQNDTTVGTWRTNASKRFDAYEKLAKEAAERLTLGTHGEFRDLAESWEYFDKQEISQRRRAFDHVYATLSSSVNSLGVLDKQIRIYLAEAEKKE